jgi:hypothetical protein
VPPVPRRDPLCQVEGTPERVCQQVSRLPLRLCQRTIEVRVMRYLLAAGLHHAGHSHLQTLLKKMSASLR